MQKMSETDPDALPLSTSKMELAVTIINGSLIYAKSPVLVRIDSRIYHLTHIIVIL